MRSATGLGVWDALALIFFIVISAWLFGRTVFAMVKGFYTSEYPNGWQRKHRVAFHIGGFIIAILSATIWYYGFRELRPLVSAAISEGRVDPNIGTIVFAKIGIPCMFWADYEAARWRPIFTGTKVWFVLVVIYFVATLGKQFS